MAKPVTLGGIKGSNTIISLRAWGFAMVRHRLSILVLKLQLFRNISKGFASQTSARARGGGNLGVILVRMCEPVFFNLSQSYTWSSKKNDLFIYTMYLTEPNVYIFIYCSLISTYPLCCL